jgi:enoyl-CoA hydratase
MPLVTTTRDELVTTIVLDDGKVNVMSVAMLGELNGALDQAEADGTAVLIAGRETIFSAGFDLAVFKKGPEPLLAMLNAGASTAARLLAFPAPVVIACGGHAIAMGAFLLLAGDVRIGVSQGRSKIAVNEVENGLTVPRFAIELCRLRLTAPHFNRAPVTAAPYDPQQALAAGFLDELVAAADLMAAAADRAHALAKLPRAAYVATKLRVRAEAIAGAGAAIGLDVADWAMRFV